MWTKGADKMTKHTPRPWTIIEVPNERRPLVAHGDLPIARIHPAQGSMEANARLIAAAPDLLEALMGARGVLYSASCLLGTSFRDDAKYWHTIADEAIRKATE